ncbi:MAG: hypothetical protein LLG04_04320 [Parachlamydia sp.]|nr:hypothetical protein [Parachlamydia sp.]
MISFALPLQQILAMIIPSPNLHARWLNTLSYLENCGARQIAACEHPTLVKEEMLKHAAEEFRHAHHLKHQIEKVSDISFDTYSHLLGGVATRHYLPALILKTSRYLKSANIPERSLKETAYLLITYAIELRAEELYPIYETLLRQAGSRVSVKSIVLEEQGHLNDMRVALRKIPSGFLHAQRITSFKGELCQKWLATIQENILLVQ